jgi:hypothetical protein
VANIVDQRANVYRCPYLGRGCGFESRRHFFGLRFSIEERSVPIAAFASRVFDTTGWRGPQGAVKLHNDAGYEKAAYAAPPVRMATSLRWPVP